MLLKRLLITLTALSIIFGFTTSCDNDRDRNDTNPTLAIEDLANTYTTKKLIINALEADEGSSVEVVIKEAQNAEIKLKNVIANEPEITFITELTKEESGSYTFEYIKGASTDKSDEWSIKLNGSFVGTTLDGTVLVIEYEKALKLEDLSKEYFGEELLINGAPAKDKVSSEIKIDETGAGTIILNNITIGEPEHEIEVVLKKGEKTNEFLFEETESIFNATPKKEGDEPKAEKNVKISGTIVNGILTLNHSVEILSDVVGDWEMFQKRAGEPELVLDARIPGNFMLPIMLRSAAVTLKPELGKVIESVSLQFSKNGKLKIGYTTPEIEGEAQNTPKNRTVEEEKNKLPLDIDYYVKDGVVYLAIPQNLFDMIGAILPNDFPITVDQIQSLVELNGLHYTLPLNVEVKKDFSSKKEYTIFYLNEEILIKLLPILEPLIPEEGFKDIPVLGTISKEEIKTEYLDELMKATMFKLGLGFEKIEITTPEK